MTRTADRVTRALAPLALVALAVACGNADDAGTTSTASPETTVSSTTTTTTSATSSTTTATTTTTTAPLGESPLPTLEDGRPATFVAVTTDHEAVEVDTQTGDVLRSFGQVATAEDVATAECAACVNAIDAVWRTYDGSHILISECCEPAAGLIHVREADDPPLEPGAATDQPLHFWTATPSPDADTVAFVGYDLLITSVDPPMREAGRTLERFAISNASWVPGAEAVQWLESEGEEVFLRTLDLTSDATTEAPVDELAGWNVAELATAATGELVVRGQLDGSATSALVLSPDGDVIDELPVETGARLGGFDRTGTFLIYTAEDGVVRWIGDGDGGVLAEGYLFASW